MPGLAASGADNHPPWGGAVFYRTFAGSLAEEI
jgi:hypothetical protein